MPSHRPYIAGLAVDPREPKIVYAAYFQCAKVLQYPEYLTLFGRMITNHFENENIDTVISPAIGGIVVGTEVGRQIGVKTIFTERKDGTMKLRRGFEIEEGERIIIVEDVLTTGGSIKEVVEIVNNLRGTIVEYLSKQYGK